MKIDSIRSNPIREYFINHIIVDMTPNDMDGELLFKIEFSKKTKEIKVYRSMSSRCNPKDWTIEITGKEKELILSEICNYLHYK